MLICNRLLTWTTRPWWTVHIWSKYGKSSSMRSWNTFRSDTRRFVDKALTVWCRSRRERCCETFSSLWIAVSKAGRSSGQSLGTSYLKRWQSERHHEETMGYLNDKNAVPVVYTARLFSQHLSKQKVDYKSINEVWMNLAAFPTTTASCKATG